MVVVAGMTGLETGVLRIDDSRIKVPELYVAAMILKSRWEKSGKTLPTLADDVNAIFDGMAGMNKDNVYRLLNAGTRKGILTINTALPGLWFLSKYFGIPPEQLLVKMGAERLRRYIYAALDRAGKTGQDFLKELSSLGLTPTQKEIIGTWFGGSIAYGDLYNQSPVIADCCNKLGLFKQKVSGKDIREIIDSIND